MNKMDEFTVKFIQSWGGQELCWTAPFLPDQKTRGNYKVAHFCQFVKVTDKHTDPVIRL